MKFTLHIRTDCNDPKIKDECCEAVAAVLSSKDKYFAIGYNPNEPNVIGVC